MVDPEVEIQESDGLGGRRDHRPWRRPGTVPQLSCGFGAVTQVGDRRKAVRIQGDNMFVDPGLIDRLEEAGHLARRVAALVAVGQADHDAVRRLLHHDAADPAAAREVDRVELLDGDRRLGGGRSGDRRGGDGRGRGLR